MAHMGYVDVSFEIVADGMQAYVVLGDGARRPATAVEVHLSNQLKGLKRRVEALIVELNEAVSR